MVGNGRTYPRYRRGDRFLGRRVNLEGVPALPAGAVRRILDDPRRIPYLLVWRSPWDGEIKEAVRVVRLGPPPYLPEGDSIEVKRTDGTVCRLRVLKRALPRNSGQNIFLPALAVAPCGLLCTGGNRAGDSPTALKILPGSATFAQRLGIPQKEEDS